jgi:hypothetical protein
MKRSTTSTRKKRNYKEKAKIYATSAAGSMAVEVIEELAAVAPGRGVEVLGAEVEEAAEGVIRDTILGAYSFAFSKNLASPKQDELGKSQSFPSLLLCLATEQGQSPLRLPV